MKKIELLIKSREAMLSAVSIYNNPQITFKAENYITLAIISWTYLHHVYYANKGIDFRYYKMEGKRKKYYKTKYGAYKKWDLSKCLQDDNCPLDFETKENLKFLIGIRHEIEHQMTNKIDNAISAKLQACSINYNYYIKKLFGEKYGVDRELGFAIQFSPIDPIQKENMINNEKISDNVRNFISEFENNLTDEQILNSKYAYRVLFAPITVNRKGQADNVIEFIKAESEEAQNISKAFVALKETEKKKFRGTDIVTIMNDKGYKWFNIHHMTNIWKNELKDRKPYGIQITPSQWMWYENWIPIVENFCRKNDAKYRK